MQTRAIHDQRILLPDLDIDDLDPVEVPPRLDLADALITEGDWKRVQLASTKITRTRFDAVNMNAAVWDDVSVTGSIFDRVDLSSARLTSLTLDRCHLIGCQLTGLHLSMATLKNVIFENCRLDYATFNAVRTTGPVAFIGCTLTETSLTGCKLGQAVITGCQLNRLELHGCDLYGTDLRGNPLDTITGIDSLKGATLAPDQLADLTTAVLADLGLRVEAARPGF
ncbi:MAG: pentapeptide repeat-containing protein [Micromonosporaceae bacterium]